MQSAAKAFFFSPRFAVAGASSDTRKFGHKVFAWYLAHDLPVTPLNPNQPSIHARSSVFATVADASSLPRPTETSLSVITPPPVTLQLLKEAKQAGVQAVWLQPGSFDEQSLDYAKKEWPGAAVAGGGACVLVHGEDAMGAAGRREGKL
ncbi:hypothetical protein LTR66_006701 [Elasticomyces elasticus]|nr:hypothetical protein LTR66_006701 [Elasticomyces elasticus]